MNKSPKVNKTKKMKNKSKIVDWKQYCYGKKYAKVRENDLADNASRIAMGKMGYMELMMGKHEFDDNGKNIVEKIQFQFCGAPNMPIMIFNSWNEVKMFIDGERTVISIMRY